MVALQFLVLSAVVRIRLGQRFMLGVLKKHTLFLLISIQSGRRGLLEKLLVFCQRIPYQGKVSWPTERPLRQANVFSDDQQYINVKRMCDTSSFLYNAFQTRARSCRPTGFHMQADGAAFGSPSGDNCGLAWADGFWCVNYQWITVDNHVENGVDNW